MAGVRISGSLPAKVYSLGSAPASINRKRWIQHDAIDDEGDSKVLQEFLELPTGDPVLLRKV